MGRIGQEERVMTRMALCAREGKREDREGVSVRWSESLVLLCLCYDEDTDRQ